MKEKTKYILIGGVGLIFLKLLLQSLIGNPCGSGGLGCVAMILLFETPGLTLGSLLGLDYNVAGIVNIPLYFLIGGLIGLIVYKIKNKT